MGSLIITTSQHHFLYVVGVAYTINKKHWQDIMGKHGYIGKTYNDAQGEDVRSNLICMPHLAFNKLLLNITTSKNIQL